MKGKSMLRAFSAVAAGVALFACLTAALLVVAPGGARAHSYKLGDIAVGHIWAKPPENGADGVPVYVPILNSGKAVVHLLGASTAAADKVRLRKVAKDGSVTWPSDVALDPGKPFALAAWHEHLWVSGLHKPLKSGDWFNLTLDFGDKGKLPVKVLVEATPGH
jgi:periplasmic copper chaperone A